MARDPGGGPSRLGWVSGTVELRHLRYFVAVAEELHFGRAAERLHVAQPAVSQQIRRLEKEIGLRLLARSSRGVSLTEAGRAFLTDARASLDHSERAVREARKVASGESGCVRVGLVGSATHGVLTGVMGPFRERFPGVSLAPFEMSTIPQLEALRGGRLDAGFLYLPPNRGSEDLEVETFAQESLVAVLPASHPLAASRRVALGEMSREPFVVVDRALEPVWNERSWDACKKGTGFAPDVAAETADLSVALGLVAAGVGVALLPASVRDLKNGGIVYRELAPPAPTVELCVARARTSLSPAAGTFLLFAKDFTRG